MKKIILATAIILMATLAIGGAYFFYKTPKNSEVQVLPPVSDNPAKTGAEEEKVSDIAAKGTLPEIQTNPLDDKPDLNPIDKTNPYSNIKTNPFK